MAGNWFDDKAGMEREVSSQMPKTRHNLAYKRIELEMNPLQLSTADPPQSGVRRHSARPTKPHMVISGDNETSAQGPWHSELGVTFGTKRPRAKVQKTVHARRGLLHSYLLQRQTDSSCLYTTVSSTHVLLSCRLMHADSGK